MQFHVPGTKVDPPLRINGQRVLVTYSALYPGELTFDTSLAACHSWGDARRGLREYAIGLELHAQPAHPGRPEHVHIYVEVGKAFDLRDRRHTMLFDLAGYGGRVLHPEVRQVDRHDGDRQRVIKYVIKDGDYVSELHTPLVEDAGRDAGSDDEASVLSWAQMLNKVRSLTIATAD